MTTSPPYTLDDKTLDDLPDLAVDADELKTDCECDEADPTTIKHYDKWWLRQCKTCGAVFWRHDFVADYGDPRLDAR